MPRGIQDPDCTVFVSNVEPRITEEHLWELFLQAGPLRNVYIPIDRANGKNKTFAFITYRDECSVLYACELFNSLLLFQQPIYCKPTKDGKQANQVNSEPTTPIQNKNQDGSFSATPYDNHVSSSSFTATGKGFEGDREQNHFQRQPGGDHRSFDSPYPNHQQHYEHYHRHDSRNGSSSRHRQDNYRSHDNYYDKRYNNYSDNRGYNTHYDPGRYSGNQEFRRSTSYESPGDSPHFGPIRHDPTSRRRPYRQSRSQPY